METHFIEHLVANQSEYDELRELAAEYPEAAERLYERFCKRVRLPDSMDDLAYGYVFEDYDPLN